ncbi:homeobox protein vent1-like [Protopterus annectens]|uniref:homeobox protein vent1-like n=1 Tax=Protopterus annectens TaxID=7888 RepID=UPI001CFC1CCD|nr:homeobox protein vent1-like [Protopterus annectens]
MKHPFSVEWLSQSSTTCSGRFMEDPLHKENNFDSNKPHIPCTAPPRQPTSYFRETAQPKAKAPNSQKMFMEMEETLETDMSLICEDVTKVDCTAPLTDGSLSPSGVDSGYESERSDCQSQPDPAEECSSKFTRRLRTAFTSEQIYALEKAFKKNNYLGTPEKQKLAAKLKLTEVQIKTWFQNRRMKLKRQLQDLSAESHGAAPFPSFLQCRQQSVAPLQYYCYPRQEPLASLPILDPRQEPLANLPILDPLTHVIPPFQIPVMPATMANPLHRVYIQPAYMHPTVCHEGPFPGYVYP